LLQVALLGIVALRGIHDSNNFFLSRTARMNDRIFVGSAHSRYGSRVWFWWFWTW